MTGVTDAEFSISGIHFDHPPLKRVIRPLKVEMIGVDDRNLLTLPNLYNMGIKRLQIPQGRQNPLSEVHIYHPPLKRGHPPPQSGNERGG